MVIILIFLLHINHEKNQFLVQIESKEWVRKMIIIIFVI
jgi:hypothetical protein